MSSPAYARAEAYLLATIGEVASPRTAYKLDRMRALLHRLDDPQRAYPSVHVAGTSGKGSTATLIAAALAAAGKRTALHTKPHLASMTERVVVDSAPISPERFGALLDEMMPAIEAVVATFGRPTYYETLLALALLHFAQAHVDVAVIEAGLGGRLDGTNVIVPEVAAITSIGFDHTEVLGDTLSAIAREKAGIAKPGVPLVVAPVDAEARAAIGVVAAEAGAPVIDVEPVVRVEALERTPRGQRLDALTARGTYRIRLPLAGAFQRRNVATALAVLEALPAALRPALAAVERGFERVAIPGRMEVIGDDPPVVFDIAHNPEKMAQLRAALHERFPGRALRYVVAVSEGKDAPGLVALLRDAASVTFTRFDAAGRSAIAPMRLSAIARGLGIGSREIEDPREALHVARATAAYDDVVIVTGSTFIVATLRAWWSQERVAIPIR